MSIFPQEDLSMCVSHWYARWHRSFAQQLCKIPSWNHPAFAALCSLRGKNLQSSIKKSTLGTRKSPKGSLRAVRRCVSRIRRQKICAKFRWIVHGPFRMEPWTISPSNIPMKHHHEIVPSTSLDDKSHPVPTKPPPAVMPTRQLHAATRWSPQRGNWNESNAIWIKISTSLHCWGYWIFC